MPNVIKLSSPETRHFWQIPVVHEDADLLALDKPSDLPVSPDPADAARPTLLSLLHKDIARNAPWTREREVKYLANAHRLDPDTTGVLLLAKNKPALIDLADQFGSEKPHTTFIVLVRGTPEETEFEVDLKIAPHPMKPGRMRLDLARGKKSITRFKVLEEFNGFALLECQPLTARLHQIRVHLMARQLPVVGDSLYGNSPLLLSTLKKGYRLKEGQEERPLIGRAAIHAARISLDQVQTREPLLIEAPWPKDLNVSVQRLRRHAP